MFTLQLKPNSSVRKNIRFQRSHCNFFRFLIFVRILVRLNEKRNIQKFLRVATTDWQKQFIYSSSRDHLKQGKGILSLWHAKYASINLPLDGISEPLWNGSFTERLQIIDLLADLWHNSPLHGLE